jgi:hypothetical protein
MFDVLIPDEKLEIMQTVACGDWMMDNVNGSAIGRVIDGAFYVTFEDENEAPQRFKERWL